ncbi:MAG: cobalt ECF transporter T component CbiQ [Clostridiales bacterium 38-18]|nr:MAG: cobalt ECF transporter T component CbiQ [Clostridiales bacterium 38-18]
MNENWFSMQKPVFKLLAVFIFLIMVSTVPKYGLSQMLYFTIFPIVILIASGLPVKPFIRKMVLPSFLAIGIGLINPFLDVNQFYLTRQIVISAGWISFFTLWLKSLVCVGMTLLLVATTEIDAIGDGLLQMKVPKLFVSIFVMTYRMIVVLVDELERGLTAYLLRSNGKVALNFSNWGSFVGQWFIRTADRGERLHHAMLLRGFEETVIHETKPFQSMDVVKLMVFILALMSIRILL